MLYLPTLRFCFPSQLCLNAWQIITSSNEKQYMDVCERLSGGFFYYYLFYQKDKTLHLNIKGNKMSGHENYRGHLSWQDIFTFFWFLIICSSATT